MQVTEMSLTTGGRTFKVVAPEPVEFYDLFRALGAMATADDRDTKIQSMLEDAGLG